MMILFVIEIFIVVLIYSYKNGVGAPVLNGSLGAIVLGRSGSGGGMRSFDR